MSLPNISFGASVMPMVLSSDFGPFPIEDEKYLVGIGLGVGLELIGRKRGPGDVTPGGIADHSGEVTDQKNNVVPEVLKLAELVELHRVAEMQIGPGRVEAFLDSQWLAAPELGFELGFDDQFVRASFEDGQLVGKVDGHGCEEGNGASATIRRSAGNAEAGTS